MAMSSCSGGYARQHSASQSAHQNNKQGGIQSAEIRQQRHKARACKQKRHTPSTHRQTQASQLPLSRDSSMRRTGKAFIRQGDTQEAPQFHYPVRSTGSQQQGTVPSCSEKCASGCSNKELMQEEVHHNNKRKAERRRLSISRENAEELPCKHYRTYSSRGMAQNRVQHESKGGTRLNHKQKHVYKRVSGQSTAGMRPQVPVNMRKPWVGVLGLPRGIAITGIIGSIGSRRWTVMFLLFGLPCILFWIALSLPPHPPLRIAHSRSPRRRSIYCPLHGHPRFFRPAFPCNGRLLHSHGRRLSVRKCVVADCVTHSLHMAQSLSTVDPGSRNISTHV